jgi:hypothetical protein
VRRLVARAAALLEIHPPRGQRRDFGDLAGAITVMAANDKRQRGLRQAILPWLSEEDVMQGTAFEMGKLRGEQAGKLEMLAQLYELRLQRALAERERAVIAQRLEKLGAARLLRAPQEMAPDALAAWLGDPAAN